MTEELFRKVMGLSEKKRKNEEAVPKELLETKYKRSYENLCGSLKDAQCQLRVRYMESIREVSALASDTVYMDFSLKESWGKLVERCDDIYFKYPDPFTKNLLVALQKSIRIFAGDIQSIGQKEE